MISVKDGTLYLKAEYGIDVTTATITNWIKNGNLEGNKGTRWFTTVLAIDTAMARKTIPPKAGRKRTYTKEQREQMCSMRSKKHSLKEIAAYFDCDQSLVSLICRGLR